MTAIKGTTNNYPEGQCTVYANSRYHDLTGYYVPWSANAKDWATQAPIYGWSVSSKPIVPSIICLQAGVQGADSTFGHVGVVESVSKGSVTASNLNWGPHPSKTTDVTFVPGNGVSFIYATDANNKPIASTSSSLFQTLSDTITSNNGPVSLAPNADVTVFLWTLDQSLALTNPFDNINAAQDTIAGVTITDPVSWFEGFGINVIDDASALIIRMIIIIIGLVILLKVLNNFIDFGAIADTAASGVKTLAMAGVL